MVTGSSTGTCFSTASVCLSPSTAANWIRAGPACLTVMGKRTSLAPWAAISTRRRLISPGVALRPRTSTSTVPFLSVWLCTITAASKRSPTVKKRGSEGRISITLRTLTWASPLPKRSARPRESATAMMRKVVMLSGILTVTSALPAASVSTEGL